MLARNVGATAAAGGGRGRRGATSPLPDFQPQGTLTVGGPVNTMRKKSEPLPSRRHHSWKRQFISRQDEEGWAMCTGCHAHVCAWQLREYRPGTWGEFPGMGAVWPGSQPRMTLKCWTNFQGSIQSGPLCCSSVLSTSLDTYGAKLLTMKRRGLGLGKRQRKRKLCQLERGAVAKWSLWGVASSLCG